MKKLFFIFLLIFSSLQVQAFEDYIITTDGKLTDIRIENNQIIDVYPLITVLNEKNTLIVHPLQEGKTCFTIKKNNKESHLFTVKVEADKTYIQDVEGFDILAIDIPPAEEELLLDLPPFEKFRTGGDF